MAKKKLSAKEQKALEAKKHKQEMLIVAIVAAVLIVGIILAVVITGFTAPMTPVHTHDHDHETPTTGHVHDENCEHEPVTTEAPHQHDDTCSHGDGATLETAVATHYVTIEIEDYGTIKAELYGNSAPGSVENFVKLAQSGFYDGLNFHRIIEGFMMQGGAPGSDSPTVQPIDGEFTVNGFENNLLHKRGVLSMARTNEPNSATSQFFIMHKDYPSLDGKYAAFGMVIEGIEVVDAICEAAEPTDDNGSIAVDARPVISSITVEPVPEA